MRARPLNEQAPDKETFEETRTVKVGDLSTTSKRSWNRTNRVSRDTGEEKQAQVAK